MGPLLLEFLALISPNARYSRGADFQNSNVIVGGVVMYFFASADNLARLAANDLGFALSGIASKETFIFPRQYDDDSQTIIFHPVSLFHVAVCLVRNYNENHDKKVLEELQKLRAAWSQSFRCTLARLYHDAENILSIDLRYIICGLGNKWSLIEYSIMNEGVYISGGSRVFDLCGLSADFLASYGLKLVDSAV